MPVYECICSDCRKVSRIFTRSVHERLHPACSHCQGRNLRRKISRVVIAKGTRRAIQDLVRSRLMGRYEGRDKARQAAWSRRTANELGEAGSDFREMAEKAEAGEDVWDLYDPAPVLEHKLNSHSDSGASPPADAGGERHAH